jgi:hypothetical protein
MGTTKQLPANNRHQTELPRSGRAHSAIPTARAKKDKIIQQTIGV